MSDSQTHKSKAEPVTVALPDELRARLDREAVRRSVEVGRPVSRSSVVREYLERAMTAAAQ
jgi:Arc/MetJ-type ribon-helix-helix transcriptional regulator